MTRSISRFSLVLATVCAFAACGGSGENGDDDDVGPDGGWTDTDGGGVPQMADMCPDECIPTCHLEALQQYEECMPSGTCAMDQEATYTYRCYGNGVRQSSDETDTENERRWYDQEGNTCFRVDATMEDDLVVSASVYYRNGTAPTTTVEYPDPSDRTKAIVTCAGQAPRNVDLGSAACAQCMPDMPQYVDMDNLIDELLPLPRNPDPPGTCSAGACSMP